MIATIAELKADGQLSDKLITITRTSINPFAVLGEMDISVRTYRK